MIEEAGMLLYRNSQLACELIHIINVMLHRVNVKFITNRLEPNHFCQQVVYVQVRLR